MADHTERIEALQAHVNPVLPDDPMSEAARKVLLLDLIQMLKREPGSRSGKDIEDVHDMRVATRRMRSVMRLLEPYFKAKTLDQHQRSLRKVARALGAVRDLDVMLDDLKRYQQTLDADAQAALQSAVDLLEAQRSHARVRLVALLDKPDYQHFLDRFGEFVTTPGAGAKQTDSGDSVPVQARYLLPIEVYNHLAAVRAYGDANTGSNPDSLHLLRIECKRLRYLVSVFTDVLGKPGKDFITELKTVQDHLGRLNDLRVAQASLAELLHELDDPASEALQAYIATLAGEEDHLRDQFPQTWQRFSTKTVQRLLATAVAGL